MPIVLNLTLAERAAHVRVSFCQNRFIVSLADNDMRLFTSLSLREVTDTLVAHGYDQSRVILSPMACRMANHLGYK